MGRGRDRPCCDQDRSAHEPRHRDDPREGRREEEGDGVIRIERPGSSERAHREEQGIARQKWRDDEARLREDDRKNQCVDPRTVGLHEFEQVFVAVKQEVDEFSHARRAETADNA